VASVFYYLRWIAPAILGRPTAESDAALVPAGRWSAVSAYGAGAASLLIGVGSGAVLPLVGGSLLR
jgi:NADH-quinone oxidoreductase subunit N